MRVRERRHEAGGRLCRLSPAVVLMAGAVLMTDTAGAAVLCAKARKDGTFNSSVKLREACKPGEVQLDAAAVGMCCTVTTTTTSGTTATTCPPTTTTTSLPLCSAGLPSSSCIVGVCSNGSSCASDTVTGECGCTGPPPSCGAYGTQFCGGTCPAGSACQIESLPPTACLGVRNVCRCVATP
jgi:hypothetical protein